jgi:hypothetical protein
VKKDSIRKKKTTPAPKPINPFGAVDDDDDSEEEGPKKQGKLSLGLGFSLNDDDGDEETTRPSKRRKGRWDAGPSGEVTESKPTKPRSTPSKPFHTLVGDTLDKFMDKLQAGALGSVATQISEASGTEMLSIDVGGSMMRVPKLKQPQPSPVSGGIITSEQLAKLSSAKNVSKSKQANPDALYTHSDWESDAAGGGASEVSALG